MDIRSHLGLLRMGLAAACLAMPVATQCFEEHFAPAATPLTLFAHRLDTDGVRLAARARGPDRTYIFESLGGAWVQTGQVTPPDIGTLGYGQPLAIDGDTLVTGHFTSLGGAVRIYERAAGVWSQVALFVDDAPNPGGEFGRDVDVCGDVIVVGATKGATAPGQFPGLAHVFERIGGTWTEVVRLAPPDPAGTTQFGQAVAVDGERLAVTCDRPGPDAVFMYERVGGRWLPTAEIEAPSAQDSFGLDLELDGDTLAVGDPFYSVGPGGLGAVHVYLFEGGTWSLQATLRRGDPESGSEVQFAERVALDGDRIVAGASGDDNAHGLDAGAVYVFERQGGVWAERSKHLAAHPASNAFLGEDVAAAGGLAFAGAPHGFSPSPDGAVYQLDLVSLPGWTSLGSGLVGGGTSAPRLEFEGTGCSGHLMRFEMSGAHADPGGLIGLVIGLTPGHAPLLGGTLVPSPDLLLVEPVPAVFAGTETWSGTLPESSPPGLTLWVQAWVTDFAGPQGWAATNALRVDTD